MRQYPLKSLRDWREASERSQARANEQRERERFVPSWIEAVVWAVVLLVLLVLLKAALPV